jgi:hypothetical protein
VKPPYWRKDKDGKLWLGRGLVQITRRSNWTGARAIINGRESAATVAWHAKALYAALKRQP